MTCPHCGREMVRRKSRYGVFMGCSGFPSCAYTCKTVENDAAKDKAMREIEKRGEFLKSRGYGKNGERV